MTRFFVLAACALALLGACKVDHEGSFEHDAGFVAASASVAVQIGHPPPPVGSTAAAANADAGAPIGPRPPR